ncbi:IS1634 family transposase [Methanoculleus chikugoensis]|uniref:IS1634 family transposase n=1 Tax=Methanoculleus chikugoensis TaxID=118126 RepID=UPI000B173C04|nr:IS1634 family transposase [Methanoculleus chikugoensis]
MPTSADFIEGSNVSIGHLGIVAGAFDTLGIAEVVDRAIPKTRHHHLTHGDIVKAMVLNGLGFVERRLYLYPEFFSEIAVDRLLGEGITTEHLNDDVLGRTLDAIAAYGPTELFNAIVAECLLASDYGTHCLHVDTTTFSVSGEYDADFDSRDMTITYGHPKDGRWDLKQFVLGMATDQHGIPLFLQTFSGNESDKKTLLTIITQLTENLQHPGKVYHIADAAFYTAENLATLGTHTFWISRVPATLNEVKDLVAADLPPCTRARTIATDMRSICLNMPASRRSGSSTTRHRCRSSRRRHSQKGWRMTEKRQRRRSGNSAHGSSPASRMPGSPPRSGCRSTCSSVLALWTSEQLPGS